MAEEQDQSQKTEEPTHKKISDAREKGDVANSREVSNFFMLLSGTIAVTLWLPGAAADLKTSLRHFIAIPHDIRIDGPMLPLLMSQTLTDLGRILLLPLVLFIAAAVLSGVVQNGFLFSPERLKPNLSKLSLIKGAQRMFSLRSVTELIKGLLKIGVVGTVALFLIMPVMSRLPIVPSSSVTASIAELHAIAVKVLVGVVAAVALMALADALYQRYEHIKKLRMTKEEVKDEMKQSEGDPHVKARLKAIRTERARQRMMQAVPTSDVVITNPTHYAVALKYDRENMAAPTLVAKGVDAVAQRIREAAEEHDVPIVENPPLARALHSGVELDEEIKAEHYQAVAEVIAYVMGLNGPTPRPAGA